MANRLSQIATRTGDNGTTGLGDNTRVSKDSRRVHAMGDVDELNSNIGVLLCEDMPADVHDVLVEVQHQLFNLGGELSIPGFELLKPKRCCSSMRRWKPTTPSCRAWPNSFCRPATAPLPWPMCAAPSPAAPSAPWSPWASKTR